jgi:hypothetical protein
MPLTIPVAVLPRYVMLDTRSQWHVSGLLSTALESMTLPSRLKNRIVAQETLDQLGNTLNINGKQTIAKLRMSIDQTSEPNGHAHSRDMRVPLQGQRLHESCVAEQEDLTTFDMDFFPMEEPEHSRGPRKVKRPHVFGQAEIYRASWGLADEVVNDDRGNERSRRRAAGLPTFHK